MKYAITGHTSGIGKAVFEKLGRDIKGFSRSNGYDITLEEDRKRIIQELNDVDVFINNAHCEFAQTLLLIDVFKEWRENENKIIVNIGSRAGDPLTFLSKEKSYLLNYQAEKIVLREMSQKCRGKCKIKYISFGYVGTENILKKYPNLKDYVKVEEAVDSILKICCL